MKPVIAALFDLLTRVTSLGGVGESVREPMTPARLAHPRRLLVTVDVDDLDARVPGSGDLALELVTERLNVCVWVVP